MVRALLLLCALAAALPAQAQMTDGLAGTWTLDSAVVAPDVPPGTLLGHPGLRSITFSTAGTAIVRLGVSFSYAIEGDTLRTEIGTTRERFGFEVAGDTLTIDGFGRGLAYARVGGSAADGLLGFWKAAVTSAASEGVEFLPAGQGALVFDSVSPFAVSNGRLSVAMDLRGGPPTQDATLRLDGDTLELMQDGASGTFSRAD